MNGTTNYMLSRMQTEGVEYGEVLEEAQALGYAEGVAAHSIYPHSSWCMLTP
jgi:hypothetical protein